MSATKQTGQAGLQIVWFFEKPTVVVCEACEIPLYYDVKRCPVCKGKVSYFVKEEE